MNNQKKTVLVTGARGFIGTHTCMNLAAAGLTVIRMAHLKPQNAFSATGGSSCYIDSSANLSEPDAIERALIAAGLECPDALVHLAARRPSAFVGKEADSAAEVNRVIDEGVFRFCSRFKIQTIYSSGTSVYGLGGGVLKVENSPANPIGAYAQGKLMGEELGGKLLQDHNISFTALRISAPYGPFQQTNTVIRIFVGRALQNLPLLYDGSGSRMQDFTFAMDIADAILLAVRSGRGGTYNIATGRAISMKQLAELVRDSIPGCKSEIGPSGKEDPQEGATALFSVDKARLELGWRAETRIEAGVGKCVAFESERVKCE